MTVILPGQCSGNRCLAGWTVAIPHRGRRGGTSRANSKKDLDRGRSRGFCALQEPVGASNGEAAEVEDAGGEDAPELQPARRMATASAPPVDILAEQVPCPRIDYQQQRKLAA
jgi:hypothetical protein